MSLYSPEIVMLTSFGLALFSICVFGVSVEPQPVRRMGLGVQFSTAEIYRPDQGFIQSAKLNATIIEEQIDRFLKDGKKPPSHKEIRPEISGLQAIKASQVAERENERSYGSEMDLRNDSVPLEQSETDTVVPEFLPAAQSQEEVSERNSSSFMLLCLLGVGLALTLGGLYYKNKLVL